jgi:YidC/Oxa1 family membrane protein insertase
MDGNNVLWAMLLCILVLASWQYFIAVPQMKALRASQSSTRQIGVAPSLSGVKISKRPEPIATNEERLRITTPSVNGSLLLRGARFDDLRLRKFRTTTDPKSPEVVLLAPQTSSDSSYVEMGWLAGGLAKTAMPDAATEWKLVGGTQIDPSHPVLLEWDNGQGLVFHRRIAVDDKYMFTVEDSVQNRTGQPVTLFPYASVVRNGVHKTQKSSFVHEGFVGISDGRLKDPSYKDFDKDNAPAQTFHATSGWLGITDQYWMAALIPPSKEGFDGTYRASPLDTDKKAYQADYRLHGRSIMPGGTIQVTHRLFAGAKVYEILRSYENTQNIPQLNLAIDWGYFRFITKPLFLALDLFNRFIGNFGLAILLLTVTMKALFFPLTHMSFKSAAQMKRIQPLVKDIQERFAADKPRQHKETLELYKREKVKPFVFGCLPMAIQLPVFISLLTVLYATIEMYHAPFYGWVHDLSASDPTSILNLFGLLPYHIPAFIPAFLSIGLWPILWGITQWVQTALSATASDPVQSRVSAFMPIIMMFLYAGLPVGLVIYYTWNNFLTIGQQYLVMRMHGVRAFPGARAILERLTVAIIKVRR